MKPAILILAALAVGCAADDLACSSCSAVDAGAPIDAAPTRPDTGSADAGAPDAGLELEDAGTAGTDSGSGTDSGTRTDAGDAGAVCDLVTQEGCGPGFACRRSEGELHTLPPSGPPHCERAGLLWDWYAPGPRCDDDDPETACRRGSFCLPRGVCARFCDPAGEPCGPTQRGEPQRCEPDYAADAFDPYCVPL